MHFLPKLSKMTLHLGQDRDTPQLMKYIYLKYDFLYISMKCYRPDWNPASFLLVTLNLHK